MGSNPIGTRIFSRSHARVTLLFSHNIYLLHCNFTITHLCPCHVLKLLILFCFPYCSLCLACLSFKITVAGEENRATAGQVILTDSYCKVTCNVCKFQSHELFVSAGNWSLCFDLGKTLNAIKVPFAPSCVNGCSVQNFGVKLLTPQWTTYHPILEEQQ